MLKPHLKFFGRALIAFSILCVYVIFAFVLSRHTAYYNPYKLPDGDTITFEKAKVTTVLSTSAKADEKHPELLVGSQKIKVVIQSGTLKGKNYEIVNNLNYDTNYLLKEGQTITVSVSTAQNGKSVTVNVNTPLRTPALYLLIAFFLLLLIIAGGKKGIRSLGALVFTFAGVLFIFIPLLYNGAPPQAAALIFAFITASVSLLVTGGINSKSIIAVLGTFGGCAAAAIIELVVSYFTGSSGYTLGDTDSLLAISSRSGLKVGGLLFAAVLISSLGAVMDISISVASSVAEVYSKNPTTKAKELFGSGMNVGRDMMGTMANTLILAFTGSSLVALIQIYTYNMPYLQVLNSNNISAEIIQAITGCSAAVITVPLVSLLSAKLLPVFKKRKSLSLNIYKFNRIGKKPNLK